MIHHDPVTRKKLMSDLRFNDKKFDGAVRAAVNDDGKGSTIQGIAPQR
jgi:hypothetical protein